MLFAILAIEALIVTIMICIFSNPSVYFKISLFALSIITFVSLICREKVISTDVLNAETTALIAVMLILILGYIFGSSFILGRFVAANLV